MGHVDEVVSFAPDGQHIAAADSNLAWALLLLAASQRPTDKMNRGVTFDDDGLAATDPISTEKTVGDLVTATEPWASDLKTFNLGFIADKLSDVVSAAAAAVGATPAVSPITPGAGNTGGATLATAGAFTAFMGNMPSDPTYRVTVTERTGDLFKYRVERSFDPSDPTTWTPLNDVTSFDGLAAGGNDVVFGEDVYFFGKWWSGVPNAGDTFSFSVDRDATLISLPVLFVEATPGKAVAFTPNVVNSIVSGATVIFGDPLGPTADLQSVSTDGDVLRLYTTKAYRLAGYQNVVPVDQNYYHTLWGGVHCGTNFIRVIPSEKWWTQ